MTVKFGHGGMNVIKPRGVANPGAVANRLHQAMQLHQAGQLAAARRMYESLLAAHPDQFDALHMLGVLLFQLGQHESAHRHLVRALKINPSSAAAYVNLGLVLRAVRRYDDALKCFESALRLRPDLLEANINRGGCLIELRRFEEAILALDLVLSVRPEQPEAMLNKGIALRELYRFDNSVEILRHLVELHPKHVAGWRQLGNSYFSRAEYDLALDALDRALAIAPGDSLTWVDKARVLLARRHHMEALACCDEALRGNPDLASAHLERANVLLGLQRYPEAWEACERASQLDANDPAIYYHRARIAWHTGRKAEALDNVDMALRIRPDMMPAYLFRADVLSNGRQYLEAERDLLRAVDIAGESVPVDVRANLLSVRAHMCHWGERAALQEAAKSGVLAGRSPLNPFEVLYLADDPVLQKIAAQRAIENVPESFLPVRLEATPRNPREGRRLRVGYMSPDFKPHPIMTILAEVFERHDRSDFEWFGFSLTRNATGPVHERAKQAFDHFLDISEWSDEQIVDTARKLGIDVMVDLAGHTEGNRWSALAMRCAPAQVTYIGYPGTSAIPNMDYIFGSPVVTPPGSEPWFTEQPVRLPWLVPVSPRPISDRVWTRADVGLPEDAIVFCSFNNTYKFTPEMFDVWMRVLRQVEGSVLWLYGKVPEVEANLRREAQARGVDPARLFFAGAVDMPNYVARMRLADLFLDTHPFNAHTTALDAVWAGLPVLTFTGGSFVSRMAAGVLSSIGLTELVAANMEDYEARAVVLGRDPARLAALRERLSSPELRTSPPFDTARFARYLEGAYRAMHERALAGLPPAPLEVGLDGRVTAVE
jgi:protein O-GlcNAc transferase